LRSGVVMIGLLQLNDRRRNMFTLELVRFFEGVGVSIGIALSRKQAEEELKAAYSELKMVQDQVVQSAKLSSLGQLAGGVAHEINNPLTGVINNVQLIKMRAENKESFNFNEFKEILDAVEESAIRCKNIAQSLLDFSHASKNVSVPLSLNGVVEKVVALITQEFKLQDILLQTDLSPDLPLIIGDSQLLQQVVLNLVSNARWAIQDQSSQTGGTIAIKTRYDAEKREACVFVSDSGSGISKENLEKIFDAFFSTKGIGEGTGLGLSLAKDIVSKYGGRIEVKSPEGEGATFKISFPVIAEAP
jgi:two-component system, NtrC family, sensor kinase